MLFVGGRAGFLPGLLASWFQPVGSPRSPLTGAARPFEWSERPPVSQIRGRGLRVEAAELASPLRDPATPLSAPCVSRAWPCKPGRRGTQIAGGSSSSPLPRRVNTVTSGKQFYRQQAGGAVSMLPRGEGQAELNPDTGLEQEAEGTVQQVMRGGELGSRRAADADVRVQRVDVGGGLSRRSRAASVGSSFPWPR